MGIKVQVAIIGVVVASLAVVATSLLVRFQDLDKLCHAEQRDWQTWQRVIEVAQHPTAFKVSPTMQRVLDEYATQLRVSVGKEPSC